MGECVCLQLRANFHAATAASALRSYADLNGLKGRKKDAYSPLNRGIGEHRAGVAIAQKMFHVKQFGAKARGKSRSLHAEPSGAGVGDVDAGDGDLLALLEKHGMEFDPSFVFG